jgi:hypothetical protein
MAKGFHLTWKRFLFTFRATSKSTSALMNRKIEAAAEQMDWAQVALNGGPPCFHVGDDGRFCGRAQRWDGHDDLHRFVSLADLLTDRHHRHRLKLRFDVLCAKQPLYGGPDGTRPIVKPKPAVVEFDFYTELEYDWERNAFLDRLDGIDVCQLTNTDDGTVKLRDGKLPVRIAARHATLKALREAVRADQRRVEKSLDHLRAVALSVANEASDEEIQEEARLHAVPVVYRPEQGS